MEDKYVYIWSFGKVDGVRILEAGKEGWTYRSKKKRKDAWKHE